MDDIDEVSRLLGNIEGEIKGMRTEQERQGVEIGKVVSKTQHLEIKAAGSGGVVSLIVAVGFSMLGLPHSKG